MRDELTALRAAEASDAKAKRQVEARAEIDRFMATADAEYRAPAQRIAAFLEEWRRMTEIARDAGVESPHSICRERRMPDTPAREMVETIYFDTDGNRTNSRYVEIQYYTDPKTGQFYTLDDRGRQRPLQENRSEQRTRTIPGAMGAIETDSDLLDAVRLPRLAVGEQPFWMGRPREAQPQAVRESELFHRAKAAAIEHVAPEPVATATVIKIQQPSFAKIEATG